jgi:hypothetical protein
MITTNSMLDSSGASLSAGSIAEMLAILKKRGYKLEFRRDAEFLYCVELEEWITPEHFTIDESYYFEEVSNPDEDRVVYAISWSRELKGILVDTRGVYTDNVSPEMMQKLQSLEWSIVNSE